MFAVLAMFDVLVVFALCVVVVSLVVSGVFVLSLCGFSVVWRFCPDCFVCLIRFVCLACRCLMRAFLV